jgi:hypothetical protein
MICVLYRTCLVLAVVGSTVSRYRVVGVIPLLGASVESAANGRGQSQYNLIFRDIKLIGHSGLQCHTAHFTWKVVFDVKERQYEIMFNACSEKEEGVWQSQLRECIAPEGAVESRCKSEYAMPLQEIKSVGPAFGSIKNFSRRLSIRRAATVGPKSSITQVIIRNTEAQISLSESRGSVHVARSQSHMSAGNVPTLAPRRAERVRLEGLVGDVWSRDVLPFPGMGSSRTENAIRASANSVMRKLSMVSVTSTFSRQPSTRARQEEDSIPPAGDGLGTSRSTVKPVDSPKRPTMVDFHTAPNTFLSEDLGLKAQTAQRPRKLQRRVSMGTGLIPPASAKGTASRKSEAPPLPCIGTAMSGTLDGSPITSSCDGTINASRYAESAKVSITKKPTKSKSRLFRMFG